MYGEKDYAGPCKGFYRDQHAKIQNIWILLRHACMVIMASEFRVSSRDCIVGHNIHRSYTRY